MALPPCVSFFLSELLSEGQLSSLTFPAALVTMMPAPRRSRAGQQE